MATSNVHVYHLPCSILLRHLYCSKSTSTSTSFSNSERTRASEPMSFWPENEIAVVILLRVFARMA